MLKKKWDIIVTVHVKSYQPNHPFHSLFSTFPQLFKAHLLAAKLTASNCGHTDQIFTLTKSSEENFKTISS